MNFRLALAGTLSSSLAFHIIATSYFSNYRHFAKLYSFLFDGIFSICHYILKVYFSAFTGVRFLHNIYQSREMRWRYFPCGPTMQGTCSGFIRYVVNNIDILKVSIQAHTPSAIVYLLLVDCFYLIWGMLSIMAKVFVSRISSNTLSRTIWNHQFCPRTFHTSKEVTNDTVDFKIFKDL